MNDLHVIDNLQFRVIGAYGRPRWAAWRRRKAWVALDSWRPAMHVLPGPASTSTIRQQPSFRTDTTFGSSPPTDQRRRIPKNSQPWRNTELTPSCGFPSCSWSIAYSFRRPWLLLLLACISTTKSIDTADFCEAHNPFFLIPHFCCNPG